MSWVTDKLKELPRTVQELAVDATDEDVRAMLARANQDFMLGPLYRIAYGVDSR